jgi:hypothetical protein
MKTFKSIPTFVGLLKKELTADGIGGVLRNSKQLRRKSKFLTYMNDKNIPEAASREQWANQAEALYANWLHTTKYECKLTSEYGANAIAWEKAKKALQENVKRVTDGTNVYW